MGKIARIESNLFPFPKGAFIANQKYLYINTSNKYIPASERKDSGKRGYTGHEQTCIGVVKNPEDKNCRWFYANQYYRDQFLPHELPDPPRIADSVSAGLFSFVATASEQKKLASILGTVFGSENARQILDLASYMISRESAVMQHYPAWAREHMIFSENIQDDTFLGRFLKSTLTIPKINQFKFKWAVENIGDGTVYLCYDSTNVNCQADGVFIVQRGHAKDDPSLPQVNTDYVIRQADGMPLTYMHSPGSVTDIAQAQEMIRFFEKIAAETGKKIKIVLICDRGYISEKNLKLMDNAHIDYLLMLRSNFNLHDDLAEACVDSIQSYENKLTTAEDDEKYGLTKTCTLYDGGKTCYAHVIWSENLYRQKRDDTDKAIDAAREELKVFIETNKDKSFTEDELIKLLGNKWILFNPKLELGEPRIIQKKVGRGRGSHLEDVSVDTFRVVGFTDDKEEINKERKKSGIYILVSSRKMTAQQAIDAYAKRDCVEKMFEALKSHMGMDKIGVTTEEAIHGKGLIWFVASILYSILFNGTESLRVSDRKHYTVPAMVDELEALKADKDLTTGKYKRRYKMTRRQSAVLGCWGIKELDVDERIDSQLDAG